MRRRDGEIEFEPAQFRLRTRILAGFLVFAALALFGRSVKLQVLDQEFLAEQGDMRSARVAVMPAHRGTIFDRNGEPLAVSSPVDTIWVNPPEIAETSDGIGKLARALKRNRQWLEQRITSNLDREFLYVARHMEPAEADKIKRLEIPGMYLMREYRRYYPNAEVTGHVLGFTNLDEAGQEGLELEYDQALAGRDGRKRVIQDGRGRIVQNVESIRAPVPGEDLHTSIDLRVQYLAYRELKAALREHRARAGSVIVIDVTTGEVLAMVNQPSFNPNDRQQYDAARYRNRAVTDIFEPGSSIKPLIVAAALSSGRFTPESKIDTTPFYVGPKRIEDKRFLGTIDVGEVLSRSSNVGMSKMALQLDRQQMYDTLSKLGIGEVSASGFPGESAGHLPSVEHWGNVGVATMSYGYGLSVTPLQLAQAYATFGAEGLHRPVTFRRVDQAPAGERVLSKKISRDLIGLLELAVGTEGTGIKASVPGYRVAGKTGTAWTAIPGGYSTDRYRAVFAGLVPASQPRLAVVVMIEEPTGKLYYGGDVSAPVFSAVTSGALRLMSVAPDDVDSEATSVRYARREP